MSFTLIHAGRTGCLKVVENNFMLIANTPKGREVVSNNNHANSTLTLTTVKDRQAPCSEARKFKLTDDGKLVHVVTGKCVFERGRLNEIVRLFSG